MAEALVSLVVEQLGSVVFHVLEPEVRLVVGVEKEVEKLISNLKAIQAVIADAETKQMNNAAVRNWLEKLKDVAYDIEDVLDDWKAAIPNSQTKSGREVCSFLRSFCCKQAGLANKIRELNECLDEIAQEKERYNFVSKERNQPTERPITTSMIDIIEAKGREEDKSALINMLLGDGDRSDLRVLSIVGMGGIGKTTLAQFAFNDDRIKEHFEKKIWICVSDHFDERRVAEEIYESLLDDTSYVKQLQRLLEKIGKSIEGKKFLLVLDDVWEENPRKWNQLKQSLRYGSPGSKVLVTTRNQNVASNMGCLNLDILKVGILSDDDCWLIISKIAFFERSNIERENLEKIGREISKKCRGLPLVAKALGGILRFRKTIEHWQSILGSEVWDLEEAREDVITPLWLSYYNLSPALKRCFSYCAIFPKDYKIEKRTLIELWMAQGYLKQGHSHDLEVIGEYYFQNLAMCSFFQDFKKDEDDDQVIDTCKMHNILHDLAQIVAWNECHSVQVDDSKELIKKVRHLCLQKHGSHVNTSSSLKKMRSLFLWSKPTTEDLSSLLSELTHARSLSLRDGDFVEIPSSINKLVRLRWLDLSHNRHLKKLPKTICELHNLQTIDVTNCCHLELPLGIRNLINLRHLHNYCSDGGGASRLPKGITQLTCLKTLQCVDVGCDGDDAFSLGDLKNLNQLRGTLVINRLGAFSRHVGEAEEAELKKKEGIIRLDLRFQFRYGGQEEDKALLEALKPSPNLEFLCISFYRGTSFPVWMTLLKNLTYVKLFGCYNSKHLPPLGKLPSLETLVLEGMLGVEKVGIGLLGMETQIGDCTTKTEMSSSSSSSSSSLPVVVAFPKLTKLVFIGMNSWEEWDDYCNYKDGTSKPPSITIMSSLCSLEIEYCQRLKALPDYILQNTMLHKLKITNCDLLERHYKKEKGEDWSKISPIPDVRIYH